MRQDADRNALHKSETCSSMIFCDIIGEQIKVSVKPSF